ncbi:putative aminotransferase [Emiliania huxleyi CCMP1516]|uniref:Prephenate dehydratase domain-containing protein n=2 Tax=Emiliania huxleyi TaxID=2903 RepID=A0A0D3JN15_EMIH1|nr:putative aminotransferase [Emiliania huxleyi CCMP1516]EOD24900.1 putative aminotransferase [Emiliania huxleyi CCMP1516]|eukprot:XP_005777329.1 putative aminotransferase [Emiliania huxleyi CCMP1516]
MSQPTVGFQGVPGAYSESASIEAFAAAGVDEIQARGFHTFEDVFVALSKGAIDYAVLPVENTLGGSIHVNYDLLLRFHGAVHILGEYTLRVRHTLLALPGVQLNDIKKAMSHPQALAQTESYLRTAGIAPLVGYDTAGSAELVVQQGLRDTAAIASIHAAKVHGLEVLDYGIEDDPNNFTRFLILSRAAPPPGALLGFAAKTSVVFTPHRDEAGVLFKAMSVFAVRDINLSKIESRPHKPGVLGAGAGPAAGASGGAEARRASAANGTAVVPAASFEYTFYVDLLARRRTDASPPASSGARVSHGPATRLRVGIVGFGTFGQFLARRWVGRGHAVFAHSRGDYAKTAAGMGVAWVPDAAALSELSVDVLFVATSILSFEKALVVDVLSVKAHAKQTMLAVLPPTADVLCTHPMFGPDSGRHGWQGLPCVYDQARAAPDAADCRGAVNGASGRCQMVKLSCERHDALAAASQFVTHLTGRLLSKLQLQPSPIATQGFKALLQLVDNTRAPPSLGLFCARERRLFTAAGVWTGAAFSELRREILDFGAAPPAPAGEIAISRTVAAMPASATVAISDLAIELKRQGKPVISLSVGEPDFSPPPEVMEAAHEALREGKVKYTALAGSHELRSAVCDDLLRRKGLKYEPSQVVCCCGAKQAILQAVLALCNPGGDVTAPTPRCDMSRTRPLDATGDEIIVPTPYWPSHLGTAQLRGAMLILCNPSNPTGALLPRAALEGVAAVLRRHPQVVVLADEIYELIAYDEPHVAFATLEGMYERTLTVNGFSKGAAMTGFRLGYVCGPHGAIKAMAKVQGNNTSCPSSIAQHAGVAAVTHAHGAFAEAATANFRRKRDYVVGRLRGMAGVSCPVPQGAFYVFPTVSAFYGRTAPSGAAPHDSTSLCDYLLREEHLALVPGAGFGAPGCVRISYATSMEALQEAMDRMERGLAKLCK